MGTDKNCYRLEVTSSAITTNFSTRAGQIYRLKAAGRCMTTRPISLRSLTSSFGSSRPTPAMNSPVRATRCGKVVYVPMQASLDVRSLSGIQNFTTSLRDAEPLDASVAGCQSLA